MQGDCQSDKLNANNRVLVAAYVNEVFEMFAERAAVARAAMQAKVSDDAFLRLVRR